MKKAITAKEAAAMVKDGMTIMVGGFLAAGSPNRVIEAIAEGPAKDLTIICNDAGYPDKETSKGKELGCGLLIAAGKVKKLIASHIGTNPKAIEGLNNKTLEIQFVPQGSLAEKVRAGGQASAACSPPPASALWSSRASVKSKSMARNTSSSCLSTRMSPSSVPASATRWATPSTRAQPRTSTP